MELVDCDFDDKKVYILDNRLAANIVANIVCENNNSDIAGPCRDDIETDLFVMQDDTITVNYTLKSPWRYQGNKISLENVGKIDGGGVTHSVMMCDNTYYMVVAFELEDDDDAYYHEIINTPVVKYGNTSGSTPNYATVVWNSGINKWNAEMNLTDPEITSSVFWNCRVTLCDSTKTGANVETAFTLKGPQPCDRIESLGGGGDPEEEEEEEEE